MIVRVGSASPMKIAIADPWTRPKVSLREMAPENQMIKPTIAKAATRPFCSAALRTISHMAV